MFKKKVKFYCSLPEVLEKYPIISAKGCKPLWLKESAASYKKDLQNAKTSHVNGVIKCTGIQSVFSKGFIMRTWHDLTIKTGSDPYRFEYFIPEAITAYLQERNYNNQLISWFSGKDPSINFPISDNCLKTPIKFITPWAVQIPVGWSLLIQPIPYPDDPIFTATPGILGQGDFYEINPIVIWNKLNSEILIKAGTPICQLIPVKDDEIDVVNLPFDEKIKNHAINWKFNIGHRFIRDHK